MIPGPLQVKDLRVHYPVRHGVWSREVGVIRAVDGISFTLARGETFALVGESGCGKSTTARAVTRLIEPTGGQVLLLGQDITHRSQSQLRNIRPDLQIVFQDPYSSLSGRMTVHQIIGEPLRAHGRYRRGGKERVDELMERVGLQPDMGSRYAREFSGGQRQRIGIARALALDPKVLVLDEPVSALDLSIQAQVIDFLETLQTDTGIAYLFIAHDLSVVRHISDRVAVMYLGKIVESGPRQAIYGSPLHPYTQALLSAAPIPDPRLRENRSRISVSGELPSPANLPTGCRFSSRCWKAQEVCKTTEPPLVQGAEGGDHAVACHFPESVDIINPPTVRRQ